MKYNIKNIKTGVLLCVASMVVFTSCNKDLEQITEPAAVSPTGSALGETLKATANDSLYYRLIIKSGLLNSLNNKATTFTMFVPDNNAMRSFINAASGAADGMKP